jgi:hypothetical protein
VKPVNQLSNQAMNHPYVQFEKTPLWKVLDAVVTDLQKNQDIVLTTTQQHVVGYLCQELLRQKLVMAKSLKKK